MEGEARLLEIWASRIHSQIEGIGDEILQTGSVGLDQIASEGLGLPSIKGLSIMIRNVALSAGIPDLSKVDQLLSSGQSLDQNVCFVWSTFDHKRYNSFNYLVRSLAFKLVIDMRCQLYTVKDHQLVAKANPKLSILGREVIDNIQISDWLSLSPEDWGALYRWLGQKYSASELFYGSFTVAESQRHTRLSGIFLIPNNI